MSPASNVAPASGPDVARPLPDLLAASKRELFELMARALLVVGAVAFAIVILQDETFRGPTLVIAALTVMAMAVCAYWQRLPWRRRGWLMTAALVCSLDSLLYHRGFVANNYLVGCGIVLMMLTGCLGVRHALGTLLLFLLGFALVGWLHVTDPPVVDPAPSRLTDGMNWLRVGAIFSVLAVFGILLVGTILSRLDASLRRSQELREEVERATVQRLEALTEQARLEAELHRTRKLEALGRLAGGVAHDLNNLLTIIIGNAHQIGLVGNDEARDAAGEIEAASERATRMARNLLTVGNRQSDPHESVALDGGVERSLQLVRKMMPDDVTLTFESGDVGEVNGSATDLDQIVMNLCLNARDAMPDGGRIHVRTSLEYRGDQSWAVLRVADDGLGIPGDVLPNIFDPFFTTKGHEKGTGLGLAVVQGIARQHGGHVEVETEFGRGTTFEVLLSLAEKVAPRTPPPPAQRPSPSRPVVLVLEAEEAVRRVLCQTLRAASFEVHDFAHGDDLLAWCEQPAAAADLLVTEVKPNGDVGLAFYERARARLPELLCLVCSAALDDTVAADFFLDPRHARLDKPFHGKELVAAVRALLANQTVS